MVGAFITGVVSRLLPQRPRRPRHRGWGLQWCALTNTSARRNRRSPGVGPGQRHSIYCIVLPLPEQLVRTTAQLTWGGSVHGATHEAHGT